jgi:hypothetical protein
LYHLYMFYLYECEIHSLVYGLAHMFNNSTYIFVRFNCLIIVWIFQ